MNVPRQYTDQTGNMIASLGGQVAAAGAQLPSVFEQSKVWKDNKIAHKSAEEFKARIIDTLENDMRKAGIDPATVNLRGLNNSTVSAEEFGKKAGEIVAPLFKGKEGSPMLGEETATRAGIASHPMVSASLGEQKAYRSGEAIGNAFDQKYPVEAAPQKQTILGEESLSPVPMPEVDPEKEVEKEGIENIRMIRQLMKDGKIDPGMGSQMIIDGMSGINKNRGAKIALQKEQERQAKADADKQWGQTVGSSLNTNEIVVPGGGPVTKENLSSVGIGGVVDKGTTGSGKGTGTGRESSDKGTASWRQYKDIEAGLAKLRSGKDEDGSPLIYDTDPDKNKIRIAEEYQAKMNQSAQQLLSHWLETSGEDYDAAQNMSLAALTSDVVVDMTNRNEPYILGSNKTTGGQTIMQLNLAHPQTMKSLVDAAKAGYTASDVLASLKKLRGLNPSKIN